MLTWNGETSGNTRRRRPRRRPRSRPIVWLGTRSRTQLIVPLAVPMALGLALGVVVAVSGGPTRITVSPAGAQATPSAIGTATGTISRFPVSRRPGRRRRVFPPVFLLQVSIPSTSVHAEYLEGDVRPVPARCGRKAGKSFCRL